MMIETKYCIGDLTYFVYRDKIVEAEVQSLFINVHPSSDPFAPSKAAIEYRVNIHELSERLVKPERDLFANKQAVKDSL